MLCLYYAFREWEYLLRDIKITHTVPISAYSHEENGLVERAKKEIIRYLRALVYERK